MDGNNGAAYRETDERRLDHGATQRAMVGLAASISLLQTDAMIARAESVVARLRSEGGTASANPVRRQAVRKKLLRMEQVLERLRAERA